MLPDDVIQGVLERAMETQISKARPATNHFFEHHPPDGDQPRTVTIHRWALAPISDTDTLPTIKSIASLIVKEVVVTAAQITAEIVFRSPRLLPREPCWDDGAPLFSTTSHGSHRFGIQGGNIVEASGHSADDVLLAINRLIELDPHGSFDSNEKLHIFCAKPFERKLMRACAKAVIKCRVFGIRDYKHEQSWVLTRSEAPCSLLIGKPSFAMAVEESNLVAGARFVVWINDPRLAVCVSPSSEDIHDK